MFMCVCVCNTHRYKKDGEKNNDFEHMKFNKIKDA